MLNLLSYLILLFSLLSCSSSKNISSRNNTIIQETPITRIVQSNSSSFADSTELSIAIINNGEVEFHGFKIINGELTETQNQASTFETGSLTKVFTATILASKVIKNKLNLNDTINSLYPFSFKNNQIITFLELANHTSGLPRLPSNLKMTDFTNPYKGYDDNLLADYLKNELSIDTTKQYSYSNLGFGIIAKTLELANNQTFENQLQQLIFNKYGMHHSSTSKENIDKRLVSGRDYSGTVVPNWEFASLSGAGGIYSSCEDLSKFILAQFNDENKELNLTRKATFTVNENLKMGLGWHILTKDSSELYWHNGGTGGYTSSMVFDMDKKKGVIVLSNVSAFYIDSKNIDEMAFELLRLDDN
ncbi:MAG TPA: class A beta-lactamase-related serine hydrolase [Crocinitomicaceae bacterium]|nr:class A beta-lactamase-related serine hydrolase [Crocinitomicaceae bacterium]